MRSIIEDSLLKSISYQEYRDMVAQLVSQESTTGKEKTEELIAYTKLNDRRMKRWDKTLKISQEIQDSLAKVEDKITWLLLTESWCGDAAHLVPVMNKIAELNDNIDLKIVLRDENEDLMQLFLTQGSESVPKLIMIDNASNEVLNVYGPRPSEATKIVSDFTAMHGKLTPEFKEDLQHWYNKDKGETTFKDLLKILSEVKATVSL